MQQSSHERRLMRRFDMHLPAIIKLSDLGGEEVTTETQNVSARGIFFYLDHSLTQGTKIEVTMTFPPHITMTDPVKVRFRARIIRVEEPLPVSRVGIAAVIEEYEFLRSNGESAPFPSMN
ncbi:MAG TPA: PilZ domain-containing protein [Terriglobales bacterium]|jgi:hypothetical protein